MANLEFAVIDVETTGLLRGGPDRVVEITEERTELNLDAAQ